MIVRGKAGAEVEFGNTVLIGENRQGVIVDYHIFQESAPADSQTLFSSLVRVREGTGQCVEAVVTDRGFHSASNSRTLEETANYDGTCPRKPAGRLGVRTCTVRIVEIATMGTGSRLDRTFGVPHAGS